MFLLSYSHCKTFTSLHSVVPSITTIQRIVVHAFFFLILQHKVLNLQRESELKLVLQDCRGRPALSVSGERGEKESFESFQVTVFNFYLLILKANREDS